MNFQGKCVFYSKRDAFVFCVIVFVLEPGIHCKLVREGRCPIQGFPNTISSWRDCRSQGGGTVNKLWGKQIGNTLAHRNQISAKSFFVWGTDSGDFGIQKTNICKIRFCMFNIFFNTYFFNKNDCFTICLKSAGFCDSAVVNIGC